MTNKTMKGLTSELSDLQHQIDLVEVYGSGKSRKKLKEFLKNEIRRMG